MVATQGLRDFQWSGGVNLTSDHTELAQNEVPWLLNVRVDELNGFHARTGFAEIQELSATTWDPHRLYRHQMADGSEHHFLVNDGSVLVSKDEAAFFDTTTAVDADPHGADFASWDNDVFITRGSYASAYWYYSAGHNIQVLTDPAATSGAGWSTPDAPTLSQHPIASTNCAWQGYMVCGNTIEDGTTYPYRVRWSHPGTPTAWAELDYDDLVEGGSPVRAVRSYRNMLLVFFDHKVIGYVGSTPQTFQKFTVSEKSGTPSPQTVTQGHGSIFWLHPETGVWKYDGEHLTEMSPQLRPLFEGRIPYADIDLTSEMHLNFVNRRLWMGYPWQPSGPAPTKAAVSFVGAPSGDGMSWTVYQTGEKWAMAPVCESSTTPSGVGVQSAGSQTFASLESELHQDVLGGAAAPFASALRTRWAFGDNPAQKKRWRRAELLMAPQDSGYQVDVKVYEDFLPQIQTRQFQVTVEDGGDADPPTWDNVNWDAFDWAANSIGDAYAQTATLGTAKAVQLLFSGTPNEPWGVQEVIYRLRPRKFR